MKAIKAPEAEDLYWYKTCLFTSKWSRSSE